MTPTLPDGLGFDDDPPADLYKSGRQVQILTIVLTTINILAAAVMAGRILWDARLGWMERQRWMKMDELEFLEEKGGERKDIDGGGGGGGGGEGGGGLGLELGQGISTSESSRKLMDGGELDTGAWWEMIPTIDLFPFILAVTIFIQGILLAVVEGQGLNRTFSEGSCRYPSEIAWAALWITPYIILSFTIGATIRALSPPRFKPRSGRAVLYCIFSALILTLLTWIPSRVMPENSTEDICNGQLMSFVDQFAAGGLGLMLALLPIAIFMGVVVVMHLTIAKDGEIEAVEKVATGRTICYLIINILQWILMVPNYALTAQDNPQHSTSELATVVANIGGIAACGLYFYLRTKTKPADGNNEKEPSTIHLEADRPTEGGEPDNERDQDGDTIDDRADLSSIIIEYCDPSEIPRAPEETNNSTGLEPPAFLQTPRSPTSIYSKGHRSSRAPSIFSQYTTHSFKRLGDEINNMISGLRAAENTATATTSKRLPAPPTPRKPASNYTLFPPNADRPRTPHAPLSKPQVPIPTTLSRPPTRPSRAATPTINMDRRQPNPKLLEPTQPVDKSNNPSQTLQVPKTASRPKLKGLKTTPAKSFEVAIPPRVNSVNAESFMEILIWKKGNPAQAGCL